MSHLAFNQIMHSELDNAGLDASKWEIRSFSALASTSTRVADMLGLYDMAIVLAQTQSEGRGRNKNVWYSPLGGMWLSFGFLCDFPTEELSSPLIETVNQVLSKYVENCTVKPPNDLLIEDKKVCGILVETKIVSNRIRQVVVGIGINVTNELPEEVESIATRLVDHCDPPQIHKLAVEVTVDMIKKLKDKIAGLN